MRILITFTVGQVLLQRLIPRCGTGGRLLQKGEIISSNEMLIKNTEESEILEGLNIVRIHKPQKIVSRTGITAFFRPRTGTVGGILLKW
jgi:hypothetical protein